MPKTKTLLLHLTDLHFGASHSKSYTAVKFSSDYVSDLIVEKVQKDFSAKRLVLLLGGDITDKGSPNKYQYALDFTRQLKKKLKGYKILFLICPGNHDIEIKNREHEFDAFNKFTYDITGSDKFIFTDEKTSVMQSYNGWSFLSANSLFHKSKDYGLLDIDGIENHFKRSKHPIIALTHHHLIPIYPNDNSVCRNSYDFFKLCLQYKVRLILHGHVHTSFKLDIANEKKKIKIIGSGALLPKIGTNYSNQFSVIELGSRDISKRETYRINFDDPSSHKPTAIKI